MIKYLKLDDQKCVGCMSCATACSLAYAKEDNPAKARIQVNGLGNGRFHLVACDQECRRCVAECPVQAITVNKQGVVMIDKKLCVGCLACVAVCPTEAMRFYPAESTPFKCVACGICVKACPKGALEIAEKEDSPASRFPFEAAAAARRDSTDQGERS
ncbi:MAG: aldehyde:ferredoxin oxidoreductase [Spirochaetae bacterium HGW-Spirochaetae-3]|nr:MAG: aldehyde:ferredoxin oxidoreductase [Spirochaetae bacterium HGW-Spirochaetae-3]